MKVEEMVGCRPRFLGLRDADEMSVVGMQSLEEDEHTKSTPRVKGDQQTNCLSGSSPVLSSKRFYGVLRERKTGVYLSWSECEDQVRGYRGARYRKFREFEEAESFVRGDLH
uniref:ribonuclease H n=1 Tax=Physcomitrium patens TaxID=3218 RepID=A0A7I4EZS2_PHYPA